MNGSMMIFFLVQIFLVDSNYLSKDQTNVAYFYRISLDVPEILLQ